MKKLILPIILLVLFISLTASADFELSGKLEQGVNTYISNQDSLDGNVVDLYNYDNVWFKLKNNLDYPNYYYFKVNYYEKLYESENSYDNQKIDLTGNYTKEFNDRYRNKFKFGIKNIDYLNNPDNTYSAYTFNYQFRHEFNDKNQYTIDLKTRDYKYLYDRTKDYNVNTYKVNWKRDVSDKFEVEFGYQVKEKKHFYNTESNDKVGHKISVDFNFDL